MQRLVEAREETESVLTAEAHNVLAALQRSVADGERFHMQLQQHAEDEASRRAKSLEFDKSAAGMLDTMAAQLQQYAAQVGGSPARHISFEQTS